LPQTIHGLLEKTFLVGEEYSGIIIVSKRKILTWGSNYMQKNAFFSFERYDSAG